jgi:hypothetical protein
MKSCIQLLFLLICLVIAFNSLGQQTTDEVVNTEEMDTIGHSPKKAALYSMMIPGGGQVYNHLNMQRGKWKTYIKIPLIYAGLGATGFLMINNHIEQGRLKSEYLYRVDNPGETLYDQYNFYDNQGILTLRQQRTSVRDLMMFAFLGVYGFNVLDAFIGAHFIEFEVTDDLSMQFRPAVTQMGTPGFSLSLNFR